LAGQRCVESDRRVGQVHADDHEYSAWQHHHRVHLLVTALRADTDQGYAADQGVTAAPGCERGTYVGAD
jgi:hypothetical protein